MPSAHLRGSTPTIDTPQRQRCRTSRSTLTGFTRWFTRRVAEAPSSFTVISHHGAHNSPSRTRTHKN
jgi:hypothetical protein